MCGIVSVNKKEGHMLGILKYVYAYNQTYNQN